MTSAERTPRVALVTGASRGIGAAIAQALAARGLAVALHCREDRAAAEAVRAALPGSGHQVFGADLADAAAAAVLWDEVAGRLGAVDVLVNNAGVYLDHPPLRSTYDHWRSTWQRTLAVNLIGPANLSLLAVQTMAGRAEPLAGTFGRGRLVNVSSRGAFRGEPGAPAYGASKAGLNALGQSLAQAVASRQVYVFAIAPGWVETEMARPHLAGADGPAILAQHPLGRVSQAAEVAAAVTYCALDAPPAMTGGILDVNGASYLRS